MSAQKFFNLTAQEVRVDSLLPRFTHAIPIGTHYADSAYSVSIEYPEFIDMTVDDQQRYHLIAGDATPPELPAVEQYIGVARRQGTLYLSFVPIVCRDGRYQKLVSFMLRVQSTPLRRQSAHSQAAITRSGTDDDGTMRGADTVYASTSVLSSGRWVKIRIPETGIYQLSSTLASRAGFSNINKVKIYGYGGAWQPERLTPAYLKQTDDLREVPTCTVNGQRLFHAVGPVGWDSNTATTRTRNPYSDYGYYFLTEGDDPLTVDSESFTASFYPTTNDYHSLHEVDDYAWFHGGRNLYESALFGVGNSRSYTLPAYSSSGTLTVVMSYNDFCQATVQVNGTTCGTIDISQASTASEKAVDSYSKAAVKTFTFKIDNLLTSSNTITISQTSGADMRLDYLSLCSEQPSPLPDLGSTSFPVPEIVGLVSNQNHHADPQADMVIIIPTSQKLLSQAQRLKHLHEEQDHLRVSIVPADELFNEFSSGTPDANAYRRYLKMLYDRADSEADMPRYLLLLGDGAWDNRMVSAAWRSASPDDFLICYESDNSFSEVDCYVSDDYFCMLDDNEGGNMLYSDKANVAVGRLPAQTDAEATILVDKIVSYRNNEHAGDWQNTLCFMADDGNYNRHMADADTAVVRLVNRKYPAFNIKKIYWDAYNRATSSTGFSYPDVTQLIKQQMQSGALIMNYTGHGATYCLSHEQVVHRTDFATPTSLRLPLWVTASCDIMPYDGVEENIGETAMLNKQGGAIAFYGTTRTVYSNSNCYMNKAFMDNVLGSTNGRRISIGEAARLAKNELIANGLDRTANKLQYTLLGDPALVLPAPTQNIVVDSINGQSVASGNVQLAAGQTVRVAGHVEGLADFNGVVTATVKDAEQTVVCKMNNVETSDAFTFQDRLNTLYNGSDSVRQGRFSFVFAMPKDMNISDDNGLICLYAVNTEKTVEAHGESSAFTMSGDTLTANDGIGPNIYCYLNSPSFTNGGSVNTTPYFYAELGDKDGINASGSGIGHDLELIVDGEMARTYNLNSYFEYDFGDYRSGHVGYSLPALDYGQHRLLFRAWDILNNSSTAELTFNVEKSLEPSFFSVSCTRNPAVTATTFIINHDRLGSEMNVQIDIYDTAGRQLWRHTETAVPTANTYTVDWDLTVDGGRRLQTGVYLYRISISSGGSGQASQAKKLIIMRK